MDAGFLYKSEELAKLGENRNIAVKSAISLKRRLYRKQAIAEQFNLAIDKNLGTKVWVKVLDKPEVTGCKQHYLPINFVLNASSKLTPVRVVADPSCTDPGGHTLNSVQAPGTGELGSVRKVLIQNRFSQELYATDISKFFTSFLLSPAGSSLRRIFVPKGGLGKVGFITEDDLKELC